MTATPDAIPAGAITGQYPATAPRRRGPIRARCHGQSGGISQEFRRRPLCPARQRRG